MSLKYIYSTLLLSSSMFFFSACGNITNGPVEAVNFQNQNIAYVNGEININLDFPQLSSDSTASPVLRTLTKNINQEVCLTLAQLAPTDESNAIYVKHEITNPKLLKTECIAWANAFIQSDSTAINDNNFPPTPYQLFSKWDAYTNKRIVSIFIECTTFTGGAHGNLEARILNYSRETGAQINIFKLIQDTTALMDLARIEFCRERSLPMTASEEETTLFCKLSEMPMPSLLGFSDVGLVLFYQAYEIAPWSSGAIKIELPFNSLKDVFKTNFKLIN